MVFLPDVPALLLNIPIIVSLVAITRYMIGFKTWKNYPVIALSLAYYFFYQLLDSALFAVILWLLFSLLTIGTAVATRYFIRKFKINYYARVAVMYLGATFFSLIAMAVIAQTPYASIVSDHFFGIGVFLIATTIDELATLLFKKDSQEFIRRLATTVVLSLFAGLLITWSTWNTFLTAHHEVLIFVLIIDAVVAFWSAVRFTELLRFGSILKNQ